MTDPLPPKPSLEELPWVIEALLFASEEAQALGALARAAGVGERSVRRAIERLGADYEARGLRVQEDGGRYQIVTAPEYAPYVAQLLGTAPGLRLSRAALETLTIIAYKQPCTRPEVEAVRGVNSDRLITTLEQRGLLESVGTAEGPGRPKLYRPATGFYEHFGLRGPGDLPSLPEDEAAEVEEAVDL